MFGHTIIVRFTEEEYARAYGKVRDPVGEVTSGRVEDWHTRAGRIILGDMTEWCISTHGYEPTVDFRGQRIAPDPNGDRYEYRYRFEFNRENDAVVFRVAFAERCIEP